MYIATILVSFLLTVAAIPAFIRFYHRAHISGQQMHEDVKQHKAKAGTPTMGGVVFLITAVLVSFVVTVLTGNFTRPVQLILFILILYGIVGFSNAVNLTDGIDGLASISVAISLSAYSFIAYMQGKWDILFVTLSMIGALLGFFVFNHKPAKIFMGDVGSLALGGMLAALSMALHVEWTLLLIGLVYVIETGSVMLQVTYFKWTKKRYGEGRRIFRMTPFHHHLELGGLSGNGQNWSEWKVDAFMWSIALVTSVVTLVLLYL